MKNYDVIIIGAGIAGMTAAIYVVRGGKSVLVLEEKTQGGQIINTPDIENWPGDYGVSGVDLSQKIYHQMDKLGAEIEYSKVLGIEKGAGVLSDNWGDDSDKPVWIVKTDDGDYSCGAIIIAVGSEERRLGVAGEEKYIGRGVSFCATCDGAFYRDKDVVVVGGGNTAFQDALYLSGICKKVYLVHRREGFRAEAVLVDKLRSCDNVEFVIPYTPMEVIGDAKVSGLKIKSVADDEERTLDVDGVFVAVGRIPETDIFTGVVDLDDGGYVVAGEDCKASAPGVFVAGDCRAKELRQLVTAASDGAIAGNNAVQYLM